MRSSPEPTEQSSTSTGSRAWLLQRLDALLSERQRRASPSELVRYRILAGAASFMFLLNTLFTVWALVLGLSPYPSAARIVSPSARMPVSICPGVALE